LKPPSPNTDMEELKTKIFLRNISKTFRKTAVLSGVSATFVGGCGFINGVIGPNGAGKTTLLRIIMGLLNKDSGNIEFSIKGQQIVFEEVKQKMAYFPQEQSLYPDLSVNEHLEFFQSLYEIPREKFDLRKKELLHISRLEKFVNRKAGNLSGGMYKKLGLICVLLSFPEILILDEPTTGVDPVSRRELWTLFHKFANQGMLIIMTTSYMDEAERCTRILLLENGKVLNEGKPPEILEKEGVNDFNAVFMKMRGERRE